MADALKVEGAARLRRDLARAGVDLNDLKAVHRQVAALVAAAADPPRRSGRLAASVRPGATRRAAIVRAGGARVPYAGPIHWGWPKRGIKARPFIAAAAQDTEAQWYGLFLAAVEDIIEQVQGA